MNKNRYILLSCIILFLVVAVFYVDKVCGESTEDLTKLPQTEVKAVEPIVAVVETPEYPQYDIPLSPELQKYTYEQCEKHGISYSMVLSIMWVESKMDITAINHNSNGSTDQGLLQLNSTTLIGLAKEAGIDNFDSTNPYMNIDVGIYYLSIMRDNFSEDFSDEDTFSATCFAFNRGGNATRRLIEREGFSVVANSAYTQKVIQYKQELEATGTFSDYVKER